MAKQTIRPYEMSVWGLQDNYIVTLASPFAAHKGQIIDPQLIDKNDGTQELTFSIPMYYNENNVWAENPLWCNTTNGVLLVGLRKIKVIFNKGLNGEKVYEFVITKVTETHKEGQLICEIEAEGLAFQELGKVGYKLSLSQANYELEYEEWYNKKDGSPEPIASLQYWADQIFKDSKWTYEIQMDWSGFDGISIPNFKGYFDTKEEAVKKFPRAYMKDGDTFIIHGEYVVWKNHGLQNQKSLEPFNGKTYNNYRESIGLRRTDKVYEEEFIGSWENEDGKIVPSHMEGFREKARMVNIEKSNRYNATQDLAEAFEVYCRYEYSYDENYHIIGRKAIFYNNFLNESNDSMDIQYPYSAKEISREMDSSEVVTKMYVVPLEDENSESGLLTIADTTANRSGEDYILNFNYLYDIGAITQQQYEGITEYETNMFIINKTLVPLSKEIASLTIEENKLNAELSVLATSQSKAVERMGDARRALTAILGDDGLLEKSAAHPDPVVFIKDTGKNTYHVNITQEGVKIDTVHLYKGTVNSSSEIRIGASNYKINDEGVLVGLQNITTTNENNETIRGYLTYSYSPKLYYQTIYDTYAQRLSEDEKQQEKDKERLKEVQTALDEKQKLYDELLIKKARDVAEFENLMGPAIKEGNWQADDFTDFGNHYTEPLQPNQTTDYLDYFWDVEAFEDEQLGYYETGVNRTKTNYYCIDLSDIYLNLEFRNHLKEIRFFYNSELEVSNFGSINFPSGTSAQQVVNVFKELKSTKNIVSAQEVVDKIFPNKNTQATIRHQLLSAIQPSFNQMNILALGSSLEYGFYKKDDKVIPVLMVTDDTIEKDELTKAPSCLGYVTTTINEDGVVIINRHYLTQAVTWFDPSGYDFVYPRIKINSGSVKTSYQDIKIRDGESILDKYYDYSILYRDSLPYITINPQTLLHGNFERPLEINYILSNGALALYLDALEVSKTNAYPKVSYNVSVSYYNKDIIPFIYNYMGYIVSVIDYDLKFDHVKGYISELKLKLDKPWEDEITIQNYKTKFEDLFGRIVASSEQMKSNAYLYDTAASAFTSTGALKTENMEKTLRQADLTYQFMDGNLTIDEKNGIWGASEKGVVAYTGGGIFTATEKDSYGNWMWNTGISPEGINASLLRAGQIDTNTIRIYSGDNVKFQMNGEGLYAYRADNNGDPIATEYVVHNSEGLFLTNEKYKGVLDEKIYNKVDLVEVSWDGLIIRNIYNEKVFYADEKGNLTLSGKIQASSGYIGGWGIETNKLSSGTTGMASGPEDGESGVYKAFWAGEDKGNGEVGFYVLSDGTLKATGVTIEGKINASGGGTIGNVTVASIQNLVNTIRVEAVSGNQFKYNSEKSTTPINESLEFKIEVNDESKVNKYEYTIQYRATDKEAWANTNIEIKGLTFSVPYSIMNKDDTRHDVMYFRCAAFIEGETTQYGYFSVYNIYDGAKGEDGVADVINIQCTSQVFIEQENGTFSPELITLTTQSNLAEVNNIWKKRSGEIEEKINAAVGAKTLQISPEDIIGDSTTYNVTNGSATDYITISKIKQGIQGESAITVLITSSNGNIFSNTNGATILTANLYNGSTLINSEENDKYTYEWYKGTELIVGATGKTYEVSNINGQTVYSCTVSEKG